MEKAWIFQINISDGGVPKLPVHHATVTSLGLDGDDQNNKELHGGPNKAICLYSLERIKELQTEGHAVFPGSTGENVTVTGLDWTQVIPGTQLQLGTDVLLEITQYTRPCYKLENSFQDGQILRMAHEQHPGWARVYAKVLSPGELRIGDHIQLDR
ncbi:MAG: MOSC domain-containing protein [bacterium]|nr:MOSC domain-containing protein [bacterium]